ncbi:MAG: histidine--tRNA ligase [Thermoprotei archaeon]|nr:MAG: histidine--tRNA ligase [Thermoprotei archaeon]
MRLPLEPVRGMRDVLPPESEAITWLCNRFREVARSYGYREILTPTIERFQLFSLKSGEEIRRSMYVFKDKAGREVALRPEVTPSVMRVYLRLLRAQPKPIRLFYIANVFRYDEPQFGRYREFLQAGVELIGGGSRHHDLELLMLLNDYYRSIGLKDYRFKLGHMTPIRALCRRAGLSDEEVDRVLHLVDKGMVGEAEEILRRRGGVREAEVLKTLVSIGRTSDPERVRRLAEELSEDGWEDVAQGLAELASFGEDLRSLGLNFVLDPGFARGLAYYTGVIFEVEAPGLGISIAGGGRYDGLTAVYGGAPEPSTGFAIGIERTLLALKKQLGNNVLERFSPRPRALLLLLSPDLLSLGYRVAGELREMLSITIELDSPSRLSRWLSYAERTGMDYAIVIGKREASRGVAVVRCLAQWKQVVVPLDDLRNSFSGQGPCIK